MVYKLTKLGKENYKYWYKNQEAKRKEILDAHKDTNNNHYKLPTIKEIEDEIPNMLFDNSETYSSCWNLTDNIGTEFITLDKGRDFIKTKNTKKRLFVDMDGTLALWKQASSIEDCFYQNYFKDLPPQNSILEGVKRFMKRNPEVEIYILSAVLDTPYAIPEKAEWLQKYIPEIKKGNYIFVPYGKNKFNYIKNLNRNDYLLDDYTKNLLAWHKAGGTGIKCKTMSNHTNKTWNGPYVHVDFPPIIIDETIDSIIFEGQNS